MRSRKMVYETKNPQGGQVRIPFNPEPEETLKARYPKAIEKTIDVTQVPDPPPSANPDHIFDFEDGIRLIVSRDKHPMYPAEIHMSASLFDVEGWTGRGFLRTAVLHFATLHGTPIRLKEALISPGSIPHFFYEEPS